ncbi:MAG: secretin N-terminal domain-containing protein, partial [Planctomycetota bacterium]
MTLRTTRWAVRGLTVSFVAGLAVFAARAQQPPPQPSGEVRPAPAPTTQPDRPPDTQEALEKLLRLRDQMQREQEARQAEQSGATPPARPPRRLTPARLARPGGQSEEPESIEQLRERARASTQRAPQPPAAEPPPPAETPLEGDEEVVGPPESLSNVPPAAPAEEHKPEPLPTPTVKAPSEPAGPPRPVARKPGPDEPSEWFAFDATPWEDVIAHFVQRVGKPLMTDPTDIVIGGELTYKSNKRFTKDEAIDELNLIMHEKGYRFVERENHVYILPVNEMAEHIPVERVYPTVAAFEQANLRDMDFVEVYYRVPDRKAATLVDMFTSALPYYARLSALDESNQVRIIATTRDVRKFLALQKKVDLAPSDPRQMRFFEIKTNAREIERLVREFMNLGGSAMMPQVQMVRDPRTGRMMPQAVGGAAAPAEVDMVADDRTNSIIVKATADKMREIEELIEKFDQKPDLGEFGTHVIEIQHADATEVANLLNQIFQQEQGQTGAASAGWQRLRALQQWQQQQQLAQQRAARQGRAVTPVQQPMPMVGAPEEIMVEGIFERAKKTIRLVADARMNALIVYANQDGLKRVRELLEVLDKPQADNLRVFALENANVADVAPVLTQIMSGIAQTGLRGLQPGATIVPDETKNVFYVIAERDELERVASLIAQLDVPGPQQNRHVVQLKNLKPSDVAQMIHTLLATGAARGATGMSTGRTRFRSPVTPGGAAATYQVIPLDDAQMLIVICTDEEWAKVEETIQLWDGAALTNSPTLETFVIEQGDAQAIATTLSNMYRSYQHPALGRSTVYIQAEGDKVLVYGVRPAIEEIAALIAMLDVADESGGIVILPLAHADATQVAQQLQLALGVGGRRGTTTVIQAEPVTNALVVQAGKVDLGKIMDFAQRMDEQVAAQTPQRKFFTPRFAEPREVVAAVQQLYAGVAAFRGRPAGSQVKVVAAGPQVIVEAPADKLAEIEAFVTQLDDPKGNEIIIKTLKLPGADVAQIASKLSNAFRTKPNLVARFDPDPQSETILLTCAKDALEQAEALIAEYAEAQRGQAPVVEFRQMTHAQATDAAGWLREQLVTYMEKQLGRNAAAMIKVTADSRTNRVVINGPQVAVTYGKLLLDQYDVPMEQPLLTVVQNEVRKLPGLDVYSLANTLSGTFRNQPRRPDGLAATFYADPTTETLIVSAPKDMFAEIDRIIAQFEAETKDLEPEQKFIEVKNADANYIAAQITNLLNVRLSRTRGQGVAQRVNVTVDQRLNRLVLNAPKFVIPMAEALVAELDQVATTEGNIRTIALENADAGSVVAVLNDVLRERFRTKRELRVSAEPLTNSIIVCGDKEDHAEIEKWVRDLDTRAEMVRGERKIIDVINVNPHEVVAVLNAQYAPKRYGQRNKLGQEISFSVVGGRSIVVQAPPDKMGEVQDFIAELDRLDPGGVQVRSFDLKVLNAMQVQIAVQNFLRDLGGNTRPGQLKPGAFAEPTTNTLVVLAPPEHMPFIETLIRDLESKQPTQGQAQTYVLKNVRAEQVANNVDAMLKAKVAEREGAVRKTAIQTAVFAEPSTNRLFVYAPEEYQELAGKLIAMLDEEVDSNDIVHIVTLDNGDAQQIAQSLNAVIQGNLRGSGTAGARSGTATVRVTPDAGSNSIILAGLPKDLAEVERWITELEGQSTRVPELQTFQLQYATTAEVQDTLKNIFPPSRNPLDAVTISADEYTGRLIVTANRRKMRHVEQVIKQLDQKPETAEEGLLAGGRQLYLVDVNRGSPSDIAWELRDLLLPEDRGGPSIEADWFDEYLIVKCRPSEFENIERLIRQFESRAKVEKVVRTYKPKGDPEALLQYLVARGEDVVIERATQRPQQPSLIEVLWQDGEEPDSIREKRERNGQENRPVSRFETGLPLRELLLGDDDPPPSQEGGGRDSNPPPSQGGVGGGSQPSPSGGSNPPVVPPERGDGAKPTAQGDGAQGNGVQTTPPAPEPGERIASPIPKEPTRIVVQPDGTLLLHGPRKEVSDITDVLDLITEDLAKGEIVRIFRFKYGDVSAAAEILSMMFDVQQRQIVIPQPQQPQRGQQQAGRQGEEGREREQLGMLEQLRGMVGGAATGTKKTGPGPLRIATDPGHNYLIVKCEETLLPEIRQLLRELDIPPGEVQVKIFQLRGLVAEETAANIKDVLGISKVQQRRGGALPGAGVRGRPGQQGGPQQQLIEMLQQQLVSVPGVEGGAKVERVEIVANATTNSLMVSAPPEVMGLIEKVITELEELEGRDIVGIYHYPLRSARTDDLVPLLQEIFDATGGGGGAARAARGPRAAAGGSPAALGPVSVSGDPRTNTIIFAAEAKDVPIVEEQIRRLDTPGAVAEAET